MNANWEYFVHRLCYFLVSTWNISAQHLMAETGLAVYYLILTTGNDILEPRASFFFHPIIQISIFFPKEVSDKTEKQCWTVMKSNLQVNILIRWILRISFHTSFVTMVWKSQVEVASEERIPLVLSFLNEKLYITNCFLWCCPANNGWPKGKKLLICSGQ